MSTPADPPPPAPTPEPTPAPPPAPTPAPTSTPTADPTGAPLIEDRFKTAREVRAEQNLPAEGRADLDEIERLETVFRTALAPDVPTYDVGSIQGARFDEWTYTSGLGCFIASTQSVEINARLILAAAKWTGQIAVNYATRIGKTLGDKWVAGRPQTLTAEGKNVYFPPGGNLNHIINTDNVLRAFKTDAAWMLKPHPVTSFADIRQAKLAFGITRIYPQSSSGTALLRTCHTVGFTTASELGIVGMLAGKATVDFSRFQFEHTGRYHPLYLAIRTNPLVSPEVIINRILNCPWSGFVPLTTTDAAAAVAFRTYKATTLTLLATHAPVISLPMNDLAWTPPR